MFRRAQTTPVFPEWLIVGLGNPGPEYRGTKHNLGFEVVDRFAADHRIKLDRSKHQARIGLGVIEGHAVLVVKPMTFMNLSGLSVSGLAREHGLGPERILVVSDDTDLIPGRIRLKPSGSAGGHNGHKSIISALGSQEYPRLKLGIGRVSREETIDHVLGGFTPDDRELVSQAVIRAADVIEVLIAQGMELALNRANN